MSRSSFHLAFDAYALHIGQVILIMYEVFLRSLTTVMGNNKFDNLVNELLSFCCGSFLLT